MLLKLGVGFGSGLFCVMFSAALTTALQGRETMGRDECGVCAGDAGPPPLSSDGATHQSL